MIDPPYCAVNKISPILLGNVLYRERLFSLLTNNIDADAFWITGPGGSGKTTLIASYLKEKKFPAIWYRVDALDADPASFFQYFSKAVIHLIGIDEPPLPGFSIEQVETADIFALRYFEQAYQRLPTDCWTVFDNLQDCPNGQSLARFLAIAIKKLPVGMKMAIISRADPPAVMARLLANRRLYLIGGDQLNLSRDETLRLAKAVAAQIDGSQVEMLHMKTKGWVAGTVLLLQHQAASDGEHFRHAARFPDIIRDYFAEEILAQVARIEHAFLLDASFLPFMTAKMADEICGTSTENVWEELHKSNLFLGKWEGAEPIYQFHPLFRETLQLIAEKTLENDQLRRRRLHAAKILEAHNHLVPAMEIYGAGGILSEVKRLILSHGSQLESSGRLALLLSWLEYLPQPMVKADPWLMYYWGVATMLANPEEAMHRCVTAYQGFTLQGDLTGQVRSWSMIMEIAFMKRGNFYELDQWIDQGVLLGRVVLEAAGDELSAQFTCSMLMALLLRSPSHPEMERWQTHCEYLQTHCRSEYLRAILISNLYWSYCWLGQVNRAVQAEAKLRMELRTASLPLVRVILLCSLTLSYASRASHDRCRKLAGEALSYSAKHGIHVYDVMLFVYSCYPGLCTGNPDQVRPFLKKMKRLVAPYAAWDNGICHYLAAWYNMLAGDMKSAEKDLLTAENIFHSCGNPYTIGLVKILRSQYLLELGELDMAGKAPSENLQDPLLADCGSIQLLSHLALADCAFSVDDLNGAHRHLKQAFQRAHENGMPMPKGLLNRRLGVLCMGALNAGIAPHLVHAFITSWDLKPLNEARLSSHWPFQLRIYCLGRFEILQNGALLQSGGKPQQKPLALLKLLIASGCRQVPVSALAKVLWPEADGDMQHQTFNTTLHRLRRLLGNSQALILEGGELTLNPDICWTDVVACELHMELVHSWVGRSEDDSHWRKELEKVLSYYEGPFLPSENESWVLPIRERIHHKLLRTVERAGKNYEKRELWSEAINVYQKTLLIDPASELLVFRLVQCFKMVGNFNEALGCFRQLKNMCGAAGEGRVSQGLQKLVQEIEQGR